jgi:hypothetical protein
MAVSHREPLPAPVDQLPNVLGAQSQIEWDGKRYSIEGDAMIYNGSRRTAYVDYLIVRR